jgi:hypothetical protein
MKHLLTLRRFMWFYDEWEDIAGFSSVFDFSSFSVILYFEIGNWSAAFLKELIISVMMMMMMNF